MTRIDESIEAANKVTNDLRTYRAFFRDFAQDVKNLLDAGGDEPKRSFYERKIRGALEQSPFDDPLE